MASESNKEPEEVIIKASELLAQSYELICQLLKKFDLLDARFKNIELVNRIIVDEQRKLTQKISALSVNNSSVTYGSLPDEGKYTDEYDFQDAENAKQTAIPPKVETQNEPFGLVSQKVLDSDGEPLKSAEVILTSDSDPSVVKKTITKYDGKWLKSDLKKGKYHCQILKNKVLEGKKPVNHSFSFEISNFPTDLGTLKVN